jgi:F-type H+-transporting ATPase subunit b
MLELDLPTILFEILNFLLLSVLLHRFLFRPVIQRVEKHTAEKARLARETAHNHAEAARLRAELEERLAHVHEQVDEIVAQARRQIEHERQDMLQTIQEEAERVLAETHAEVDQHRRQTANEFHAELVEAVLTLSGQLIAQVAPPGLHDALVQQLNDRIWELGRGEEIHRVETLRRSLKERDPVVYTSSARELSAEQVRQLVRTFSALADRTVNVELTTEPELAAGLRVRIGDLLVDNSIAAQLAELREQASQALQEQGLGY